MNMLPFIFYTALILSVKSSSGNSVIYRQDYAFSEELGVYYKEHNIPLSWENAFVTCRAEGASLVVPNSTKDVNIILKLLSNRTITIWLGIHDQFSEGVFVTLTGIPIWETYVNWWLDEPNEGYGPNADNEDCVFLSDDGFYHDGSCMRKRKFLCTTQPVFNLTWNRECDTYDSEYVYSNEIGKCYKFHHQPTTWDMAFRICYAEGSILAIPRNKNDVKIMLNFIAESGRKYLSDKIHVGFNNILTPNIHLTNEGQLAESIDFNNWAFDRHVKGNSAKKCGSINIYGIFEEIECDQNEMFFCEKPLKK